MLLLTRQVIFCKSLASFCRIKLDSDIIPPEMISQIRIKVRMNLAFVSSYISFFLHTVT